jgi:tetratricopeptide (TPR) repeat protein
MPNFTLQIFPHFILLFCSMSAGEKDRETGYSADNQFNIENSVATSRQIKMGGEASFPEALKNQSEYKVGYMRLISRIHRDLKEKAPIADIARSAWNLLLVYFNERGFFGRPQHDMSEDVYEDLKWLFHRFPADDNLAYYLAKSALSLNQEYSASGQWQKAEQTYNDLKALSKQFIKSDEIAWDLAKVAFNLVQAYGSSQQWQQTELVYSDLKALFHQFSSNSDIAYNYAGAASKLVKLYSDSNQSGKAEEAYNDLKEVAKYYPNDDFIIRYLGIAATSLETFKEGDLSNPKEADEKCSSIFNQFGIRPTVLETDKEYYSDEVQLKTVRDKEYFISAENPHATALTTTVLIRQAKLRYELMHSNRLQKVSKTTQTLAGKIEEIKHEYLQSHNGLEPSLNRIAQILSERNIASPSGKSNWHAKTVQRIIESSSGNAKH